MSLYQVKTRVNNQVINTDVEADNVGDVKRFYDALSVGSIEEIKKYVYVNKVSFKDYDLRDYRYATVKLSFLNRPQILVKIPKLKDNVSVLDLRAYFKSIYSNALKIDITIRDRF